MKITVLDGYALNPGDLTWQEFAALGDFTLFDRTPPTDTEEIIRRIGDSEVILLNKVPVTAAIVSACPRLKYIGVLATGYNVVDLEACRNAEITVTNIPTYGTDAVAQFTFALLLEICSQVGLHSDSVHKGDWQHSPDFTYWLRPLTELRGKRLGLVGYGAIAQAVAEIAHAFKMEVVYWNHRPKEPQADWIRQVEMAELLAESDIISLHVPLFPETEKIIDGAALSRMKKGSILLNTSRGGLLEEEAVANALSSGSLAACGVDVVSTEPIRADNPLLHAENCWITPHIAWAPTETRARLMSIAYQNLTAFLRGNPQNVVS